MSTKRAASSETTPAQSYKLQICENVSYATKEAFKRLRTNLLLALADGEVNKCKIIGITSAQPSEGKSTVAINTAYSLAELNRKVLLIDADMRRPSIHTKLGLSQTPGLSNLLVDYNNVSGSVKKYSSSVDEIYFDIITGGDIPGNPSEILTSDRMEKLLEVVSVAYDYIILDLPPVGAVTDAIAVGRKKTDGMIVVIRENNCPADTFDDCIEQIKFARIKILGFVVNGSTQDAKKAYKYRYKY